MPATFTPPVVMQGSSDPFFGRYTIPVGQSVVKMNGTFVQMPYPWLGDLDGKTDGVDYFLGGHEYVITDEVALALDADGFETNAFPGFGDGGYGSGRYGG